MALRFAAVCCFYLASQSMTFAQELLFEAANLEASEVLTIDPLEANVESTGFRSTFQFGMGGYQDIEKWHEKGGVLSDWSAESKSSLHSVALMWQRQIGATSKGFTNAWRIDLESIGVRIGAGWLPTGRNPALRKDSFGYTGIGLGGINVAVDLEGVLGTHSSSRSGFGGTPFTSELSNLLVGPRWQLGRMIRRGKWSLDLNSSILTGYRYSHLGGPIVSSELECSWIPS
ncbi:MAG: hypothetical protein AAF497_08450 [Planctomycetota bacterium]